MDYSTEEEFILWETDDEEESEEEQQPQRIFVGEVRVITVIKLYFEK